MMDWVWNGGAWMRKEVADPIPNPGPVADISVTGVIDGMNGIYTLGITPTFLMVAVNGLRQQIGIANDYTISGNQLVMANPPISGSWISAVGY